MAETTLGRGQVQVRVTRDSVCAGDDIEEHLNVFVLSREQSWAAFVHSLWMRSELPTIGGGHATWVLSSGRPLAVAAQQWPAPRLLRGEAARLALGVPEVTFHWSYRRQQDPEAVWAELAS